MSSTRTLSGPRSRASRSAASRSACRVAVFFFSRNPVRGVVTVTASHVEMRTRKLACTHFLSVISAPPDRKEESMRAKGIAYDTGFIYRGAVSRERFDPGVVGREL